MIVWPINSRSRGAAERSNRARAPSVTTHQKGRRERQLRGLCELTALSGIVLLHRTPTV